MPQLIGLIIIIIAVAAIPVIVIAGVVWIVGKIWIKIINNNAENRINYAKKLIKIKTQEVQILQSEIKEDLNTNEQITIRLNCEKEKLLINQQNEFLQNTASTVSIPILEFIEKLQKKYETITSKYYLKDFGDKKINDDIKDSIEGKFPNTFSLNDDFCKNFDKLLSQVSDEKPAMIKIKAIIKTLKK
jgi:hypothetical protein